MTAHLVSDSRKLTPHRFTIDGAWGRRKFRLLQALRIVTDC